ncbi:MAG: rRNA maturation RNAse YbeY, partial [Verrucomicrobia bacterium]|nr:rRNA maturation RNAse YbeY [Verrucomicrobiota bacterium]
ELCLYLIHGLLHLVGFDDHSAEDAAIMNKLQGQLLDRLVKQGLQGQ